MADRAGYVRTYSLHISVGESKEKQCTYVACICIRVPIWPVPFASIEEGEKQKKKKSLKFKWTQLPKNRFFSNLRYA